MGFKMGNFFIEVFQQVVFHSTLNLTTPTSSTSIPPPLSSTHLSFRTYLQVPKSLSQTQFKPSVLYQTYFYTYFKIHINLLFRATKSLPQIIHALFAFLYSLYCFKASNHTSHLSSRWHFLLLRSHIICSSCPN